MSKATVISPKRAAVISLLLCLPIGYVLLSAIFHIELPFINQLQQIMYDGYQPTPMGSAIMLGMLLALPAAFVINLLSMVAKLGTEPTAFIPTLPHAIVGISSLFFVLITFSRQVLHELRPFVNPLGPSSALGNLLFLLGLLILPMAFLLNRLPRLRKVGTGEGLAFQPTSINLIIGATILLVILMFASTFSLETIACSSGVPNCD